MKAHLRSLITKHYAFIIFIIFYLAVFSHKLITNPVPFFDWDESIYAQVSNEMMNKWSLIPLWQGQIWLDKPPFVPIFYGIVLKMTPFILPEISTRLATLYLSAIVLTFLYILYYRVTKETLLTTLAIMITAFTSIFLQRSQALNIDVFLLLGWAGYMLFYDKFKTSLFFLFIAVMSKSLVGFYPAGIMILFHLYQLVFKKIEFKEAKKLITRIMIQIGILSIWYLIMLLMFGKDFWIQHIYESHTKRVTASIESHFGQRTYYIDLVFEQFGKYAWLAVLGGFAVLWQWKKKVIDDKQSLYSVFIIPWFVFLNLTKTKIFWYGYPYFAQFAFLMVYPLILLKKYKYIYYPVVIILIAMIFNHFVFQQQVVARNYSSLEDHQKLAQYAKNKCDKLYVLIEKEGRTASDTLESMDLLITTSRWWGNHPSMVYYFGKEVEYIYKMPRLEKVLKEIPKNHCMAVNKNDLEEQKNIQKLNKVTEFGTMYLYAGH